MAGRLNVDIPKSIAEFEALINKVLPKRIFYKLLLRGKGLEFDSYRNFGGDEDATAIDWKASVRSNTLLTRQYVEERDMKIVFIIDVSDNMIFGSQEKLKCEYSAELAAAFAHVLINAGDKVGFILFNSHIVNISPPTPGKKQFDIFVYNLENSETYGGVSDLGGCLESILERLDPSISLVVLISDFIRLDASSSKRFEELGNVFETIAIMVRDPLDLTLPDINKEIVIKDPGTGEELIVNPKIARKVYEMNSQNQINAVKNLMINSNIDLLELNTKDEFAFNLATFLKGRVDRRD
ncbi:Uncharacterised protein [uncultured archaeon]|nr:Uncharacterised protein [uncultured archaeon]